MPKSVTVQVAPACAHGSGSSPGGMSTITSNGSPAGRDSRISLVSSASAAGPARPVGNRPSQRSARRTGRRWGHSAATHTGILGCCTGTGWNSPAQYLTRSSRPRSSSRARSRGSATSPNGSSSPFRALPSPTPRVRRPELSRSRVTASLATLCTRLRDSGVISGPIRSLLVAHATAASATHGSATALTGARYTTWSQTKKPSQPRSSAATASSARTRGSASSPNGGTSIARFMRRSLVPIASQHSPWPARCVRAAGRERPPWDGTGGVRGAALSGWPGRVDEVGDRLLTLFLCGDVMTGRGVDQVLPHPGGPELREPHVGDAREYVRLAERASGRIPRVADVWLPQFRAARVRENLVDAAARHHIAAQEQGQQPIAHLIHSARPPTQGRTSD